MVQITTDNNFGNTSPPPNMYDTSTSTAESTSRASHSYSRSKIKAKAKAAGYSAVGNNGGSFRSAASLLVSSQSPVPSSPSRSRRSQQRGIDAAASDVSAPAALTSAAAHYVMQQQTRTRSDISTSSRPLSKAQQDGTSVTETTQVTEATQSEPGVVSSNYSYYTLTDHYSSSAAPTQGAYSPRRFSDGARQPRRSSEGQSQVSSQQPLLVHQNHPQYPASHTHYPASPRSSRPNRNNTPPFVKSSAPPAGLSVSERIRRLSHGAQHFPDPELQEEETETSTNDDVSAPLSPFYNGLLVNARQQRHQLHSNNAQPHRHSYAAPPRRSEPEEEDDQRRQSLPPVRRVRKPLQQPQPVAEQDNLGSPSRVQEMKRRLWTEDEKLNVSSDTHSEATDNSARRRREARSLSPRTRLSNNNNAGGGFKSKFYQAAMAATQGRGSSTTPPKRRSESKAATPPRPRATATPANRRPGTPPRHTQNNVLQTRSEEQQAPPTPPRPRGSSISPGQSRPPIHNATAQQENHPPQSSPPQPSPPPQKSLQPQDPYQQQQYYHHPPQPSQQCPHQQQSPSSAPPPLQQHLDQHHQQQLQLQQHHQRLQQLQQWQQKEQEQQQQQQSQQPPTYPPQQQHKSQPPPSYPSAQPPQQHQQPPTPSSSTKDGKDYIAKLVAKLNAVSRDDPQAALEQIDSILRAESRSEGSPEQTGHHALLVNAAAAAAGVLPQHRKPGFMDPNHPYQPMPAHHQPHPQQYHPHQFGGPHGDHMDPGLQHPHEEEEETSDDDTSVSSITNPTYRSAMPTHEQLHDVPPPRGMSTALYRRPRPNGLQNYQHTPAISGLELVQRHHQRQQAKKGGRAFGQGQPQPQQHHHHLHHHHDQHQHPPIMINVTTDSGNPENTNNAFTENLLKSSSKHQTHQQPCPQAVPLNEQAQDRKQQEHDVFRLAQEQHALQMQQEQEKLQHQQALQSQQQALQQQQQQARQQQQQQKQQQEDLPIQQIGSQQDVYGFPAVEVQHSRSGRQELVFSQSSSQHENESPSKKSVKESPREYAGEQMQKPSPSNQSNESKPINPFNDSYDAGNSEKQRYKMGSTGKERKLDSFMSRKQQKEEEQLLQLLERHEQMSGEALSRKIRNWDELSNPASKVSTKSSVDAIEQAGTMRATGSAGGHPDSRMAVETNPVNVSTATMSSAATSTGSTSKQSRRSHPWDAEKPRLKIDFRDTSMDNALGVEAECFSQSQASPARELRLAARMQQQQQQKQMRAAEGSDQAPTDTSQDHSSSRAPNVRPAPMERHMQTSTDVSTSSNTRGESRTSAEQLSRTSGQHAIQQPPQQQEASKSEMPHLDRQDSGFEVTPIYATQQQQQRGMAQPSADEQTDSWVAVPSNSFFYEASKQANKSKVVATLVDEDTHPVTMVRAPPEVPPNPVVDAFADVPTPYDEGARNAVMDQRNLSGSSRKAQSAREVIDVSGIQETPPPIPSESNRGRRAFANFLKKRAKGARKSMPSPGPPRKPLLASAVDSATRGRRTASKSPDPRNRARSLSLDNSGKIRNPNIAKKFSRLLKVYGNDVNDEDNMAKGFF